MATVKKRNPILIMVVIMMIFVVAIFATQLFWPATLDQSTGKLSRFGGKSSEEKKNDVGDVVADPQIETISDSDDPMTAPIE